MKLLFLPWVLKPLYSPLLERTRSRTWWLRTALGAMATSCSLAALVVGEQDLAALSVLLLLLNLCSAAQVPCRYSPQFGSQDICVDSLALSILLPSELGAGNTIQVIVLLTTPGTCAVFNTVYY